MSSDCIFLSLEYLTRCHYSFHFPPVNNYGGKNQPDEPSPTESSSTTNYRATEAVVSITLSIEGDSLMDVLPTRSKNNKSGPKIRTRKELRQILTRIAADAQVDDCLLAAELLWAPEERSDLLSPQDIAADYPELYPLLD